MLFPARELKDYAEPVVKERLALGSTYFTVVFFDEAMTIPKMETLVYLGETSAHERGFNVKEMIAGGGIFVFREIEKYHAKIANVDLTFSENELAGVYEFESALNILLQCSLDRRTG